MTNVVDNATEAHKEIIEARGHQ